MNFAIYVNQDLNECSREGGNTLCLENAKCTDTPGSYRCDCKFPLIGDGKTVCIGMFNVKTFNF